MDEGIGWILSGGPRIKNWPILTPWRRGLPDKPAGSQLVRKFPAFYGTRRFITTFTRAQSHVPVLSQINPVHAPLSNFSKIYFNIILPSVPGCYKWTPSLGFFQQNSVCTFPLPIRATCPEHLSTLDFFSHVIFGEEYRAQCSSLCSLHHSTVTFFLLSPNILLSTIFPETESLQVSYPYKTNL